MRGFLVGFALFSVLAISILSLRPGGLRHQLSNVARRLRVVLILVGIYLVGSAAARIIWRDGPQTEIAEIGLGISLAVVFVLFGRDRPLNRSS